jgi:hypothetical protein
MLYILLQLALFFDKQLITVRNNFKMLSLEQRIYLIQCWTDFRHIITKFNKTFPNTYVINFYVINFIRYNWPCFLTNNFLSTVRNNFKMLSLEQRYIYATYEYVCDISVTEKSAK